MKKLHLLLLSIFILFSDISIATDLKFESALGGCAAIKDNKQKLNCYEAVTKLSAQANLASSPSTVQPKPVKTSQYTNFIAEAKRGISSILKDPSSVQWHNVFVSQSEGGELLALCGEMNAKNSYGGYTGFKRFFWVVGADKFPWLKQIENSKYPHLIDPDWLRWCRKKVEDVGSTESESAPSMIIDAAQKEKWIADMAQKNGCEGAIRVKARNKDGAREYYEVVCENKKIEFTCEFVGEITESIEGIPAVAVSGKAYKTQPACWR